jgi:hypothetical protein
LVTGVIEIAFDLWLGVSCSIAQNHKSLLISQFT